MSLDLFETILSLAEDAGEAALVDAVLLPLLALPAVAALVLSVFGSFLPQMRAPFLRALRPVRLFAFGAALALLLFGGAPLRPALGVLLLAVLASYLLAAPLFLPVRRSGEARRGRRSVRPEGEKTKGRAADVRREEGAARRALPAGEGAAVRADQGCPCGASMGAAGSVPPEGAASGAPDRGSPFRMRTEAVPGADTTPPWGQAAFGIAEGAQSGAHPLPPAPRAPMPAMVRCFAEEPARPVVVEKDVRLGHIFSTLERLRDLPLSAGDRLEAQKTEELLTVYRAKGTLTSAEAETLNDILAALLKMMAKYKM